MKPWVKVRMKPNQEEDMGLKLGNQRAEVGNAIRGNADGSYSFVDAAGNDLSTPDKPAQQANTAEKLNAPHGGNDAFEFVLKNQIEDRGANLFGDENIVPNMNDTGSGGGIEQVDISGSLRGIEEKVAQRLGLETPKRT